MDIGNPSVGYKGDCTIPTLTVFEIRVESCFELLYFRRLEWDAETGEFFQNLDDFV